MPQSEIDPALDAAARAMAAYQGVPEWDSLNARHREGWWKLAQVAIDAWQTQRATQAAVTEPPMLITDPCRCNQGDEDRVRFHQRGDIRFCRDAIAR
jgi:hypothetical protein